MKKKKKPAAPGPESELSSAPATGKRKLEPEEDTEMAPEKKQRMSAEVNGAA